VHRIFRNLKKWSILISCNNNQKNEFNYIYNKLNYLINKEKLNESIEILYLINDENISSNRKLLIEKSKSEWINFIDVNIDISNNFINEIFKNLDTDYIKFKKHFVNQNKSLIIENDYSFVIKKSLISDNYYNNNFFKPINSKILDNVLIFEKNEKKENISIIITAYESQDFIEECLNSVYNQTYFNDDNFEVLVGVDGCKKTYEKLNEIKYNYKNLKIFMMKDNKGTYITTNTLIEQTIFENIIRFDSDDTMFSTLVENVMDFKNDYDIVKIGSFDGIIYFKKSSMIDTLGGYQPWFVVADTELLKRAVNKLKIGNLNIKLFNRRYHTNSLTNRKDTGANSEMRNNYASLIKTKYNDSEIKIDRVVNEIDKKLMNFYSIVIPTMWCSDKIFKMLTVYDNSDYVKEVIIIDNNTLKKPNLSKYKKIRYYTKNKNIYVNPSWNWGYSLSNYKLILANDDIIIDDFDDVMKIISNSDKDIIGVNLKMDGNQIRIDDIDNFPSNSYGCFMYIKNYTFIPEQFKIWYGDNILFHYNKKRGVLKNLKISTNKSETIDANLSNKKEFRENIGQQDIKEYSKLIKNSDDNFNIIIRTSGRPIYFNNCVKSIRKYYPTAKLHITIDNIEDLNYVEKCVYDFEYNYYLINKETIKNICEKIPIERTQFIYNYYFNVVKPFLTGWCLFLDDDDVLLMTPKFERNNKNNIYLYKVDIGTKIVPSISNFGKFPVLNDISGLSIVFHSLKMIDWLPQRGGDFSFISTMYNKTTPIWVNEIISKTQTGGNFGKKNDLLKFDKSISVNIATYPPRKNSFIEVINELLKIDIIDKIRIYLNEYDNIPNDFPINDKILYHIGEKNLKDSGKYFWASTFKNEYYFTLDDDLIYPKSFFINHIILLEKYNNEIFVTNHGKEMVDNPTVFNEYKKSYHCLKDVDNNYWINNGGTGVMVFDNSKFTIPIDLFKYHGMADLWISLYCQKNKIPILCREHKKDELIYINQKDTLFDRRYEMKKEHKMILDSIGTWKLYKNKLNNE
jgi:glycosyltransferase involved in cell wall biosynthesis